MANAELRLQEKKNLDEERQRKIAELEVLSVHCVHLLMPLKEHSICLIKGKSFISTHLTCNCLKISSIAGGTNYG